MSTLKEISVLTHEHETLLAIDDAGLLWYGKVLTLTTDEGQRTNERVIDWQPIEGPPDGRHMSDRKRSFWENMEIKLREAAQDSPNPDGTPLSVAKKAEDDADDAGGETKGAPDDGVQDGEATDSAKWASVDVN